MEKIKVKINENGTIATEAHPNPTGWNDVCKCGNCLIQQEIQKNLKHFVIENQTYPPNSIQFGVVLSTGKIKIIGND